MKSIGWYPRLRVDTARVAAAGHAGGVLLTETVRVSGLDAALSAGLERPLRGMRVRCGVSAGRPRGSQVRIVGLIRGSA